MILYVLESLLFKNQKKNSALVNQIQKLIKKK